MKVKLFTTLGCHLCEEAHAQLTWLQGQGLDVEVESVEIANDDALVERYGIRIPVVLAGSEEIGWPFTVRELKAFLTAG